MVFHFKAFTFIQHFMKKKHFDSFLHEMNLLLSSISIHRSFVAALDVTTLLK